MTNIYIEAPIIQIDNTFDIEIEQQEENEEYTEIEQQEENEFDQFNND